MARVGGNPGNKGGTGNPGYGKSKFVVEQVNKFSPLWWKEWQKMMESKPDKYVEDNIKKILQEFMKRGDKDMVKEIIGELTKGSLSRKQFAMQEFNKLQVKMTPNIVTGDSENPLFFQMIDKKKIEELFNEII